MSELNKEAVHKWVKALRSGEYKQGREQLRNDDDEYCCLGVACDVFKEEVNGEWKQNGENYQFHIGGNHTVGFMPIFLKDHLGLSENFVNVELVSANDHKELSFDEIANMIEEEVNS